MDRISFLNCIPWLVLLPSEVINNLRKTHNFHPILDNAVLSIHSIISVDANRCMWFAPSPSNVDCTQLLLEVSLLLDSTDNTGSSPAGLVFSIDNATFLVDHTAMGRISVPNAAQDNIEAVHGPRYAAIAWPHAIDTRIFLPIGTADAVSIQKLTCCVQTLIAYLRPEKFRHPCLNALRKGLPPDSDVPHGMGTDIMNVATPECPRAFVLPTQSPPLGQYQQHQSPKLTTVKRTRGGHDLKRDREGETVLDTIISAVVPGGEDGGAVSSKETLENGARKNDKGLGGVGWGGSPCLRASMLAWTHLACAADGILSPAIPADAAIQIFLETGPCRLSKGAESSSRSDGIGNCNTGAGDTFTVTAREAAILQCCTHSSRTSSRDDYNSLLQLQLRTMSTHAAEQLEQTMHVGAMEARGRIAACLDRLYGPPAFVPNHDAAGSSSSQGASCSSSSSSINSSSTREGGMDCIYDDGLSQVPTPHTGSQEKSASGENGGCDKGEGDDAQPHAPLPSAAVSASAAAARAPTTPAGAAATPAVATTDAERRQLAACIGRELSQMREYCQAGAALRALPRLESFFCD